MNTNPIIAILFSPPWTCTDEGGARCERVGEVEVYGDPSVRDAIRIAETSPL